MRTALRISIAAATLAVLAAGAAGAATVGNKGKAAPPVGELVYGKWCAACHDPGKGHPGTAALDAKYQGAQPAVLKERTDIDADMVKFFVRNGVSVMPPFRKTEIGDAELDALARYLSAHGKKKQRR